MYHEEKIINGVLCWRGTPDGSWLAFTPEQLTARIREARNSAFEEAAKVCIVTREDCQDTYKDQEEPIDEWEKKMQEVLVETGVRLLSLAAIKIRALKDKP